MGMRAADAAANLERRGAVNVLQSGFRWKGGPVRGKVFFFAIGLSAAWGAQPQDSSPAPAAAKPVRERVYYAGPGVAAPKLIPPQIPLEKIHDCKKLDGTPVIEVIVDAEGNPAAPQVMRAAEGNLNQAALLLVARDRFKPGTHAGAPAAVEVQIEVDLKTCSRYAPEGENGVYTLAALRKQPVQRVTVLPPPPPEVLSALDAGRGTTPADEPAGVERVGGGVSAPVPLNSVEAQYTPAARRAKIKGICIVQIIVGADGLPQDPRILKSLDPGLDQEAVKAVMRYRFKPAMREGRPVPVRITLEINFRLF